MNWSDFRAAHNQAKETLRQADDIATDMARMLVGRLRKIDSGYTLAKLKAELADFDSRTKRWKEKK